MAIGILLAPETGDKTRKMLMGKARSLTSDVGDQLAPQLDKANELVKSLGETIKHLFQRHGADEKVEG